MTTRPLFRSVTTLPEQSVVVILLPENYIVVLEGTACYAGLLLAPAKTIFGLWSIFSWPLARAMAMTNVW